MRIPRDVSGADLIKALGRIGCSVTRQTGSHARLPTSAPAVHHITVPVHDPIKVGTLSAILLAVARHRKQSRDELVQELFG